MKNLLFLLSIIFIFSCTKKISKIAATEVSVSYSELWNQLETYPSTAGRNDDLFFISPEKGWVINNQGKLYKTEDGGESWKLQFEKEGSFFRCIAFADSLNGWMGTIGLNEKNLYSSDSTILYETKDGGLNWSPVEAFEDRPTGLCGLQKVTDQMIVGCGRVRGPAYFVKTIDKGKTWMSKNLDHLAGALIAPHFVDEKNGFMIGGTTHDKRSSKALILSTSDGGETWQKSFESSQTGEYCWKIVFPTPKIGYVSIQRNVQDGLFHFLKTENGGKTWKEMVYAEQHYFTQGIGFINKDIGWIGGSSSYGTYETRDGGDSWYRVPNFGRGLNKFQFVNDTLGYAVGKNVYKIVIGEEKTEMKEKAKGN